MEWLFTRESIFFWVLCLVGVGALMTPLIRYLAIGWHAKRKDILDGLSDDARLAYYEMFSQSEGVRTLDTVMEDFSRLYLRWYGRIHFLWPGALLLAVGVICVGGIVLTVLHQFNYGPNPFFDLPQTAVAAIAGAYLWVVNDHISRARRLDFSPSDVQWAILRLVISVPMGYAFASLVAPDVGPFIAFAAGAFPLGALLSFLRTVGEKRLELAATPSETEDDISKLQGVNKAILERLQNEDIMTVTQFAYCDPVRLVMRSNLTFTFVTDCMNQAIAWTYLEDKLETLRPLGLRGATEIKKFIDDYDNALARENALTRKALDSIAATVKLTPECLMLALRGIAEDPFTMFLSRAWATTGGSAVAAVQTGPRPLSEAA